MRGRIADARALCSSATGASGSVQGRPACFSPQQWVHDGQQHKTAAGGLGCHPGRGTSRCAGIQQLLGCQLQAGQLIG